MAGEGVSSRGTVGASTEFGWPPSVGPHRPAERLLVRFENRRYSGNCGQPAHRTRDTDIKYSSLVRCLGMELESRSNHRRTPHSRCGRSVPTGSFLLVPGMLRPESTGSMTCAIRHHAIEFIRETYAVRSLRAGPAFRNLQGETLCRAVIDEDLIIGNIAGRIFFSGLVGASATRTVAECAAGTVRNDSTSAAPRTKAIECRIFFEILVHDLPFATLSCVIGG